MPESTRAALGMNTAQVYPQLEHARRCRLRRTAEPEQVGSPYRVCADLVVHGVPTGQRVRDRAHT